MAAYFPLEKFWRVGYHADPLAVSLEYQIGEGRFDDPRREFGVLYGGDSALTCIFEVALPWAPHQDATYAEQAEAPESDADPELQSAEVEHAKHDREIAARPFQVPISLYEKAKVYALLSEPIVLCDLDDMPVRTNLSQVPEIADLMKRHDVPHLDRSVMIGQGASHEITQTISGHLMRNEFLGHRFDGIRALSRHHGECYVLFESRYRVRNQLVGPVRLHREDADVIEAARQLGLVP